MFVSYNMARSVTNTPNTSVWTIVSFILAIIFGILIYFLFLDRKNEGKFNVFLNWLYDFLSFKKIFIETFLKITYLILAIFITLTSFALIKTSFLMFLLYLIVGNFIIRIVYEFTLLLLLICRNTSEINKKLNNVNIIEKKE